MNPPVAFLPTAADAPVERDRALQDTLGLLEWPRVCEHLSGFASTAMGRVAARSLSLPAGLAQSRTALKETVELVTLDDLSEGGISFRGVRDLRPVVLRCSKGDVIAHQRY